MKYKIYNQDVIEWSKSYEKSKFHALLCDPPYELNFMNQKWDRSGVAFRPETWEALGEHLHPGAFGMAFSASRNWHRLAVAIEDAGFIIHPTIFGWLNGQGFPKATNISKQIEKGRVVGQASHPTSKDRTGNKSPFQGENHLDANYDVVEFETDMGKAWQGHRYGLQALKPAVEPIIVFQKPYEGRPLDNITETGAGALNIDGTRIPLGNGDEYSINTFDDGAKPFGNGAGHKYTSRKIESLNGGAYSKSSNRSSLIGDSRTDKGKGMFADGKNTGTEFIEPSGRWASNFILDESVAERLDNQSGHLQSGIPSGVRKAKNNIYGQYAPGLPVEGFGDGGGASRFFFQVREQIDEADPIYYCSKVSPKERNAGLDEYPEVERSYMNTHNGNPDEGETWHPVDDRTGQERDRFKSKSRNPHPTLKPISLAKYLATLLLPPDAYTPRRILVPFSGVSSEMIGAMQAGWEHIVGIEFTPEYAEIAEKRMQYWKDKYERSIS